MLSSMGYLMNRVIDDSKIFASREWLPILFKLLRSRYNIYIYIYYSRNINYIICFLDVEFYNLQLVA